MDFSETKLPEHPDIIQAFEVGYPIFKKRFNPGGDLSATMEKYQQVEKKNVIRGFYHSTSLRSARIVNDCGEPSVSKSDIAALLIIRAAKNDDSLIYRLNNSLQTSCKDLISIGDKINLLELELKDFIQRNRLNLARPKDWRVTANEISRLRNEQEIDKRSATLWQGQVINTLLFIDEIRILFDENAAFIAPAQKHCRIKFEFVRGSGSKKLEQMFDDMTKQVRKHEEESILYDHQPEFPLKSITEHKL